MLEILAPSASEKDEVARPAAGAGKHGSVWVQPLAGLSESLHDPILARDRRLASKHLRSV